MFVAPPPSTRLRWGAYAAALTLTALFAFQAIAPPVSPYRALRARVDGGWKGTYFDQSPIPRGDLPPVHVEETSADGQRIERIRGGDIRLDGYVHPFGLFALLLLPFVLLGFVGWLGTVFTKRRPGPHRRPHRIDSAPA